MTRHELKEQLQHDQFSDTVSNVVNYALSHRRTFIQWSVFMIVVLILIGGYFWYSSYERSVRQQDLAKAFGVASAQVGAASQDVQTYPTQEAKTQAEIKAFSDVVKKDGHTREGYIAQYYLGTLLAQKNDMQAAQSNLKTVADSGSEMAPLAKVALSQIYAGENRTADARSLLQSIVNKPTDLVSKAQAQLLLARLDETTDPKQAKSILQSLKSSTQTPAVTQAVDQLSNQFAQ